MGNELVNRAKSIIFANEGKYSSVNGNDNGAISVGVCQWHGDRAKAVIKSILKSPTVVAQNYIDKSLYNEVMSDASWTNRTVASIKERNELMALLDSRTGHIMQDMQASYDIEKYIMHVKSLGFTDEETLIFLADIENQGGAGASGRIGKKAISYYGKAASLENVVEVALIDEVFEKYAARRLSVYKKLVNRDYFTYINSLLHTPKPPAVGTVVTTYKVKSGDTISAIAKKYGVTVDQVVKENNIEDKNIIIVGQKLRITKEV